MGLFENNKELKFGTCGLIVKHTQIQRNKREDCVFLDLGGAVIKGVLSIGV